MARSIELIPASVYDELFCKYPKPVTREIAASDYFIIKNREAFGAEMPSLRAIGRRWGWTHETARRFIMALKHFDSARLTGESKCHL